jgi:hypothetical protein
MPRLCPMAHFLFFLNKDVTGMVSVTSFGLGIMRRAWPFATPREEA